MFTQMKGQGNDKSCEWSISLSSVVEKYLN